MAKKKESIPSMHPELASTLATHPHIKDVHFTAEGAHHFNVYEHKGEKYGRIHTSKKMVGDIIVDVKTPILKTRIVQTIPAERIISQTPDPIETEETGE